MINPVIMKSGKNYITLVLDPDMDFVELLEHIIIKFRDNEHFFGSNALGISYEGRDLSEKEQLQIMDAIQEFTNVKVEIIVENDKFKEYATSEVMRYELDTKKQEDVTPSGNVAIYFDRDIEAGERISVERTILIRGDVAKGAYLETKGSIIVLGALLGTAIAGTEDNKEAFISAYLFAPQTYRIGDVLGELPRKNQKIAEAFSKGKRKSLPQVASLQDGDIIIESLC